MAGVITQERDLLNHRVVSMWEEAGIQFRSNLLLEPGARIELHPHHYDHVVLLAHGLFDVLEIYPDGAERNYRGGSSEWGVLPRRFTIPAWVRHSFTLLEHRGMPGEVLCMWATS